MGRKPVIEVGDTFDLHCGSTATVISYYGRNHITVMTSNGYRTKCRALSLRRGCVADRLHPSVVGIGIIGVGKFGRARNYDAYQLWLGLLTEVNDGVMSIQESWLNFQNFCRWFYASGWVYGMTINSTLISPEAKLHGEKTTTIIPKWLGTLLYGRSRNGNCNMPTGYALSYGKYRSRLKVKKEIVHCVSWDTEEEAVLAYTEAKAEYVMEAIECGELPEAIHGELKRLMEVALSECI